MLLFSIAAALFGHASSSLCMWFTNPRVIFAVVIPKDHLPISRWHLWPLPIEKEKWSLSRCYLACVCVCLFCCFISFLIVRMGDNFELMTPHNFYAFMLLLLLFCLCVNLRHRFFFVIHFRSFTHCQFKLIRLPELLKPEFISAECHSKAINFSFVAKKNIWANTGYTHTTTSCISTIYSLFRNWNFID